MIDSINIVLFSILGIMITAYVTMVYVFKAKDKAIRIQNRNLTNLLKMELDFVLFRNDYVQNDIIADGSSMGIHLIEAEYIKGKPVGTIYLSRPGLLIGSKGSTINEITKSLSTNIDEGEWELNVKEFLPFRRE